MMLEPSLFKYVGFRSSHLPRLAPFRAFQLTPVFNFANLSFAIVGTR